MLSVIFLDIDGVLNTQDHFKIKEEYIDSNFSKDTKPSDIDFDIESIFKPNRHKDHTYVQLIELFSIDGEKVKLLQKIIEKTNAKIVISSSWRYAHHFKTIQNILNHFGCNGEVIGQTDKENRGRAGEILHWINQNNPDKFIILDDDYIEKENNQHIWKLFWVRTYFETGLTDQDVETAISILS